MLKFISHACIFLIPEMQKPDFVKYWVEAMWQLR